MIVKILISPLQSGRDCMQTKNLIWNWRYFRENKFDLIMADRALYQTNKFIYYFQVNREHSQ